MKITVGIDTSLGPLLTRGKNVLELELMFNFGLSPMESIIASTKSALIALSLQTEIGTIEKGKLVDLIIVKGDPLKEITVLKYLSKKNSD